MKKLSFIIATLIVCLVAVCQNPSYGQVSKEEIKMGRFNKKQDDKALKDITSTPNRKVREAVRELRKQGYKTTGLPMEYMVQEHFRLAGKKKADGTKEYVLSEAIFECSDYSTARRAATADAKVLLASSLQELVMSETRNSTAVSRETKDNIGKLMAKDRLITDIEFGRMETPKVVHRKIGDKYEVLVVIAYNVDNVIETARENLKRNIRKELQQDLDDFTPFYEDIDIICDGVRCRLSEER